MMVEIPMPLPSLGNARMHHHELGRIKASQRNVIKLVLRTKGGRPPELPVVVTLTRIAPRRLDEGDNERAALKAIRDEVAAWLGTDDRPGNGITWRYAQEHGAPKYQAVRIEIDGICRER